MQYLPLLAPGALLLYIACQIISRVRASQRHVPSSDDGCCGCGAAQCDAVVAPDARGRGEGYCWTCLDGWPVFAPPLAELGMVVLPGRERSAR